MGSRDKRERFDDYGNNSRKRHYFDYDSRHDRYPREDYDNDRRSGFKNSDLGKYLKRPRYDLETLLPINKNLYDEHSVVGNRSERRVHYLRKDLHISVKGERVPNPLKRFKEANFPKYIKNAIIAQKFDRPTAIQCQGWPIALSGRDMVGIAQTGSGKTLAYVLPAIMHIKGQPESDVKGPKALILAPTRELVQQIDNMCNEFGQYANVRSIAIYGGASKESQLHKIHQEYEVISATPGRLIDFLEAGQISLRCCTLLCLDEADRMLDMGFEPQIQKIIEQIRPDKQTLMFSATWPSEVRHMAENYLNDYVQINVGGLQLTANHNIRQIVEVMDENEKDDKLLETMKKITIHKRNKTIIFAETKRKVDSLAKYLRNKGFDCVAIHGDKSQSERNSVFTEFTSGQIKILVATDVAARGLNVLDIKYVINYDFPHILEHYVHRIGRTGRCDNHGTAYTFFTHANMKQAKDLIGILSEAGQKVSQELLDMKQMSKSCGSRINAKSNRAYGAYGTWTSSISEEERKKLMNIKKRPSNQERSPSVEIIPGPSYESPKPVSKQPSKPKEYKSFKRSNGKSASSSYLELKSKCPF